jgi:hypothetical protein
VIATKICDVPGARAALAPRETLRKLAVLVALAGFLALALAGCEKTSHESIDQWMRTEKGPGKLKSAVGDASLDADLSAHAAQNLVRLDHPEWVVEVFEKLAPDRRNAVLDKLIPRLWQDARIEGEMTVPSPAQVGSKDSLFELRKFADDAHRKTIDEYLVDWFTGGYYDGRAKTGRYLGATVVRAIGPLAADRLMTYAKSVVVAPPNAQKKRPQIQDELLLGLAATGSPEAVGLILDVFKMDRDDDTLPTRAMDALHRGYVDPQQLFEPADPKALVPHLDRLAAIAKDPAQPPRVLNDAVALIRAAGMPGCLPPLLEMVSYSHPDPRFHWIGADSSLKCGGVAAIVPVAEALPVTKDYEAEELKGAVWQTAAALEPRAEVLTAARGLLGSTSWVAKWIGVEILGAIGEAPDAARLRGLAGDKTPLRGYWGKEEDLPKSDRKPVPTLGVRAEEAARAVDGRAVTKPN